MNLDKITTLSKAEIEALMRALPTMSVKDKIELFDDLEIRERRASLITAQTNMLGFANAVYPGFKIGPQHRKLAKIFTDVIEGRKKRVIINIAPRMGKSEFSSYLFPAYFLGKFPEKKIIMGTHTAGLSEDFGRRVRNLIDTEEYHDIFPDTRVAADQKAAGKWSTAAGGQYYAAGVGGALAGRGADLFVIDDPHSEQDVKVNSRLAFDTAWSWFQTGPLQRLMPGGAIIIVMTRWSLLDLTGRLLTYQTKNPDSIPWEIVELPAILNEGDDDEKSLWPEQWPLETLKATKASIEPRYWNAQYMQQPTSENSALVSRKHWRIWESDSPPRCDYILQSWDTAHEVKNTSDYSACTTWGVFYNEEEGDSPQVILLDAFKDRMTFPELKQVALKHWKEWEPDAFIVEKKAAGGPLIQELRAMGIPVQEFSPSRGNDKMVRLNAVADLFTSGKVWAPDTRWAREVIEEIAAFPVGENDDYVDTCFVGDTLIQMADGSSKRIVDVTVGEYVATPMGKQCVLAVLDRGIKEVWRVTAGDSTVTATPDHKMMTQRGWIPIDKLNIMVDTITQANNRSKVRPSLKNLKYKWSQLFLTATSTTVTQTAQTQHTGVILRAAGTVFTKMFGHTTKALCPRGGTYTTLTVTQATTGLKTSPAYLRTNTDTNTKRRKVLEDKQLHNGYTSVQYAQKPQHGTKVKKVVLGIKNTLKQALLRHTPLKLQKAFLTLAAHASGAALRILGIVRGVCSVLPSAKAQSQSFGLVKQAQNTHTMQHVYDLTVANEHCFYANGLLAHNCTQALLRYRQGGFISLDSDEQDDPYRLARRPTAYY